MEPGSNSNLNLENTKGKQKSELKKISHKPDLQVTFTKRRSGIYKKASELSTLCGAEIAIIMFSENNRVYSFGSPDVNSIIQRYTGQVPPPPLSIDLNKVDHVVDESELHKHFAYLSNQIDAKKKIIEDWNQLMKAPENQFWCVSPFENMNNDQLKECKKKLEDLKIRVDGKREKLFFESVLNPNLAHFFAGGSSSSIVDGPLTMNPTPLMQNREDVTDYLRTNGQGQKDGHTFKFF